MQLLSDCVWRVSLPLATRGDLKEATLFFLTYLLYILIDGFTIWIPFSLCTMLVNIETALALTSFGGG